MTTQTTTETTDDAPETVEQTAEAPEAIDTAIDAAEANESAEEGDKGDRSEAKLRKRAQTAEAERDTLRDRLEGYQRAEVARIAGDKLAVGADVLDIAGAALADLLDDAGNVDENRVAAVADALLETRPNLARRRFAGAADGGPRGEAIDAAKSDPIADAAAVIRGGS